MFVIACNRIDTDKADVVYRGKYQTINDELVLDLYNFINGYEIIDYITTELTLQNIKRAIKRNIPIAVSTKNYPYKIYSFSVCLMVYLR